MPQCIFTVVDRFDIKGKGTVLTGITKDDSLRLRAGDCITIKRPSLPDIESEVLGFEVFRNDWSPHKPRNFGILLPESISIGDVPANSEWSKT
jgi:hypothetical protein